MPVINGKEVVFRDRLRARDNWDLPALIQAMGQGGESVDMQRAVPVLARVVQGDSIEPAEESPFAKLTPRENEILALLAEGQSNKVIARNLGISDGTVKLHVKSILRKLGVHSRVEAAVIAVEQGLRANRDGDGG